MTSPRPVSLALEGSELVITWNDGVTSRYAPVSLRKLCPCATCVDRRASRGDAAMEEDSQAELPGLTIRGVVPVGNYAYRIAFSDGHDTGIYTLEYLYQIGQRVSEG